MLLFIEVPRYCRFEGNTVCLECCGNSRICLVGCYGNMDHESSDLGVSSAFKSYAWCLYILPCDLVVVCVAVTTVVVQAVAIVTSLSGLSEPQPSQTMNHRCKGYHVS